MSNVENLTEVVEESLGEVPESLEAPRVKKSRGRPKALVVETDLPIKEKEPSPPKVKRQQTDKQKQNFIKALEARKIKIEERKQAKLAAEEAKEQEQEVKQKERERKVVKKAIVLKKRSILEETALDEIEDIDIPDEVIQHIVKKQKAKKVAVSKPVAPVESPKPKYTFV
jgi:hypothetical protein